MSIRLTTADGRQYIDVPYELATQSKVLASKIELESAEPTVLNVSGPCLLALSRYLRKEEDFTMVALWTEDRSTFYELLNLSNYLDIPMLLSNTINQIVRTCQNHPSDRWSHVLAVHRQIHPSRPAL